MTSYVSSDLRRLVEVRANRICEYRAIHERDSSIVIRQQKQRNLGVRRQLSNFSMDLYNRRGHDVDSRTVGWPWLLRNLVLPDAFFQYGMCCPAPRYLTGSELSANIYADSSVLSDNCQ